MHTDILKMSLPRYPDTDFRENDGETYGSAVRQYSLTDSKVMEISFDGTVILRDEKKIINRFRLKSYLLQVRSVKFCPDGKYVLICAVEGAAIYDLSNGETVFHEMVKGYRLWSKNNQRSPYLDGGVYGDSFVLLSASGVEIRSFLAVESDRKRLIQEIGVPDLISYPSKDVMVYVKENLLAFFDLVTSQTIVSTFLDFVPDILCGSAELGLVIVASRSCCKVFSFVDGNFLLSFDISPDNISNSPMEVCGRPSAVCLSHQYANYSRTKMGIYIFSVGQIYFVYSERGEVFFRKYCLGDVYSDVLRNMDPVTYAKNCSGKIVTVSNKHVRLWQVQHGQVKLVKDFDGKAWSMYGRDHMHADIVDVGVSDEGLVVAKWEKHLVRCDWSGERKLPDWWFGIGSLQEISMHERRVGNAALIRVSSDAKLCVVVSNVSIFVVELDRSCAANWIRFDSFIWRALSRVLAIFGTQNVISFFRCSFSGAVDSDFFVSELSNNGMIAIQPIGEEVWLFDVRRRKFLKKIPVDGTVLSVGYSENCKFAVFGVNSGRVIIYDMLADKIMLASLNDDFAVSCAVSEKNHAVIFGGYYGVVYRSTIDGFGEFEATLAHQLEVNACFFSPVGHEFFTISRDGFGVEWAIESNKKNSCFFYDILEGAAVSFRY